MTFTAYVLGYVDQARQNLIQEGYIVPKPEGVHVNYVGKSPVPFSPFSGMTVSSGISNIVSMSYDPVETIDFSQKISMIVSTINIITIN